MKLEALHPKSYYKSTDHWLNAVYRNNKEFIDSKLHVTNPKASKKTVFKNLVQEYIDEGYAPTKALNTLSRTTVFTSDAERLRNNALKGLRGDKETFKSFRKLAGWNTKVDPAKFRYDKTQHIYVYDERITISFRNSPFEIIVGQIE